MGIFEMQDNPKGGRPFYSRDSQYTTAKGHSYLYASQAGWFIGPTISSKTVSLYTVDPVAVPLQISTDWTAWSGTDWTRDSGVRLQCLGEPRSIQTLLGINSAILQFSTTLQSTNIWAHTPQLLSRRQPPQHKCRQLRPLRSIIAFQSAKNTSKRSARTSPCANKAGDCGMGIVCSARKSLFVPATACA
jgi:hypothetical protein